VFSLEKVKCLISHCEKAWRWLSLSKPPLKKVKRLPNLHSAYDDRSFLALLGMTKEDLTLLFERR